MPLFEVAILEKPTKKESEDGAIERLIMPPRSVVAQDSQSAAISVALSAQGELPAFDKLRMVVLVRRFV